MRKLFKERKLFKGGNYMRKYCTLVTYDFAHADLVTADFFPDSTNARAVMLIFAHKFTFII